MVDISAGQLALVRAILARHIPQRIVRAFGSRVTGKARPDSDLDLIVIGREALQDLTLARLRADFEDSDLPFRVDLFTEPDLPLDWCHAARERSVLVFPAESVGAPTGRHSGDAFLVASLEVGSQAAQTDGQPEANLSDLFSTIDRLPRRRLTKEEIDNYLFVERSSWD